MRKTHYIVLLVILAQAFLLVFLYNSNFYSGSSILEELHDSRKQKGEEQQEINQRVPPISYKSNMEKYVLSVKNKVNLFQKNYDYQAMTPGKKRIKLIEYFTMHIADADYSLLGEDEQKEIMTEFLRRYAPEE
jgi:hypothetical protein